jgi:Ser/Thr protein kinase RdoA (MazF antagonist)
VSNASHPFEILSPDRVIDAVEDLGFNCDGRVLTLNSYENRVFQVGLDDGDPIVLKFYRPERWTEEQILEEHDFSLELANQELSVVPPLEIDEATLQFDGDFHYALFDRRGGYAPELDNPECLFQLGSVLGQMHMVGSARDYQFRPELSAEVFGHRSVEWLLANFIPREYQTSYRNVTSQILDKIDQLGSPPASLRVHGDCHVGNILWRDDRAHFVDFDDSRMAPAVQDIWMLLSGDRQQQQVQLLDVIEGYQQFMDFDHGELKWIEPLRTLRMMHHAYWIASRWSDPAFPKAFSWFAEPRWLEQHLCDLASQLALLDQQPLTLGFNG